MIRGNMPSDIEWYHMICRFKKKFTRYKSRLQSKFNKGRISKEKMNEKIQTFKSKYDPVCKYHFTDLEAADFYGISIDHLPLTRINPVIGNNIYSFRRIIDNILFNNTFNSTKVGHKDDNKNQEVYEKFMKYFSKPKLTEKDGLLIFKSMDERFEKRKRLSSIPTAVYDVINSRIHFTPFNLNVSKNESHMMLTDMIKFFTIYDDKEGSNWFNMTDLDIYHIGFIRSLGDPEIIYYEDTRYLDYDKSVTYMEVLFNISNIITDYFSNIDATMDALGIKFMGILISPYPLDMRPSYVFRESFIHDQLNRNIYNFYLIINQKY